MPSNKLHLKQSQILDFAESVFDEGKSVKLPVTGNGMYPFLRGGIDDVELCRENYADIRKSDIVLIRGDEYILSRVYRKDGDEFLTLGDAQRDPEGPFHKSMIVGKARAVYRGGRRIDVSSLIMRFLVLAWRIIRPFRPLIIQVYLRLRRRDAPRR